MFGTVVELQRIQALAAVVVGLTLRAQLLVNSAWLIHLIGDKAPPTARDGGEWLSRRCYPHSCNRGVNYGLRGS